MRFSRMFESLNEIIEAFAAKERIISLKNYMDLVFVKKLIAYIVYLR